MRNVADWHFCGVVINYTPVGCAIEIMFVDNVIDSCVIETIFLCSVIDGCVIETMIHHCEINGCVIETMFVDNVTDVRSHTLLLDSQTLSHIRPPFCFPENNKNTSHSNQDQHIQQD